MADKTQRLVLSILDFLNDSIQKGKVKEDDREGIEVAVQCIGEAFGVDSGSSDQRSRLTVSPNTLESIFDVYLKTREKLAANATTSTAPPSSSPTNVTTPASASAAQAAGATPRTSHLPSAEDKAAADTFKAQGNTLMSSKSFEAAIEAYTKAIALDPTNPVYYSNRAAAYSSMDQHDDAIRDAEHALEVDPAFIKAYSRLGHAHYSKADYASAITAFTDGLGLDPANANLKSGLENARARSGTPTSATAPTSRGDGGMPDLSSLAGLMGGLGGGGGGGGGGMPDLSAMMNNPALMSMAESMMANGGLERLMSNPAMANIANRMQSGGGMPDMSELMSDPSLRDLAGQFMGAAGRGGGGAPPPGNV